MSQASRDAAVNYVKELIATMGADDRAGVILFGDLAVVDRAMSADLGLDTIREASIGSSDQYSGRNSGRDGTLPGGWGEAHCAAE